MMKNKKLPILVIILIVIVFSAGRSLRLVGGIAGSYNTNVLVAHVVDGDTVELSNGEKVRYIGIDTPEIKRREGDEWIYDPRPYAEEARVFNARLVEGKKVRLEFDVQERDKYDRLLAYVYVGEAMVNLEILRQGYAMIYTYPPNIKYTEEFLKAESEAKKNNRGLWSELEVLIYAREAKDRLGMISEIEAYVVSTYLSDSLLILNCRDNFKIVIFSNNLASFPKEVLRSPDAYFKHKTIRVYGLVKEYKGVYEIVANHPSQIEIID
ncbi:MAG: thermonuclease family protein [Candidatus Omnitrophota bacterium]|jgi:micrococcal nuclease|nr:thermonuclease family protein [Candidatus Omnitrophota bacterium]